MIYYLPSTFLTEYFFFNDHKNVQLGSGWIRNKLASRIRITDPRIRIRKKYFGVQLKLTSRSSAQGLDCLSSWADTFSITETNKQIFFISVSEIMTAEISVSEIITVDISVSDTDDS